jgi:hypothetical protein
MLLLVNEKGYRETLIAAQPANFNAVKHGVHSPRLIGARAAEIQAELFTAFEFSAVQRLAVYELSRNMAILEAIDRELDNRGLVDKRGKPHYLLGQRSRTSKQLERWLEKLSDEIDKPSSTPDQSRGETEDYVRELQRIALRQDRSATTRDRLIALKELLRLGDRGTTSYLETPPEGRLSLMLKNLR